MPDDATRDTGPQGRPLDELCEYVLDVHHGYAHGALPLIRGHLASLAERDPAFDAVQSAFIALAAHLDSHLAKEELILFPALAALAEAERQGAGRPPLAFPTVLHPIRLMEAEHAQLAEDLVRLRAAAEMAGRAAAASVPGGRVLDELSVFAADLDAHLRIENHELFPRALELDRRL